MKVERNSLRESYDLTGIGSGPAGLTLVHKYGDLTTRNVLIVESGGESNTGHAARKLDTIPATQ